MTDRLAPLIEGFTFSGDPTQDIPAFLRHHDCPKTAVHVTDVAIEARRLARRFGANPAQAELAGYLHDVSAVVPNTERIATAQAWGIDVLPEEADFPMIIHQKLSAFMGQAIFGIADADVLSAAGHHTTLYAGATLLDTVVFVADGCGYFAF
jgi:HD superfamily phosphohydrolase YqeK